MTRFASLAAAGALTLAVVASVPAWADDAPVRGTAECTVLVNADTAVKTAADTLDAANGLLSLLPATAPLADREQAAEAVNQADAALAAARAAAELELCVDLPVTTDPEPTPTTEPPVETTTPAPVETTTLEPTTTAPTTIVTQINGDVTVNPTADDGSVANVSGNQVTVVPEGSVQTGAL